jgi:hypothetical protein
MFNDDESRVAESRVWPAATKPCVCGRVSANRMG